jgi:hypothetical protein
MSLDDQAIRQVAAATGHPLMVVRDVLAALENLPDYDILRSPARQQQKAALT